MTVDLEEFLDNHEGTLTITVGSRSAWSGELRVGMTNRRYDPAISYTIFVAGCGTFDIVLGRIAAELEEWLLTNSPPTYEEYYND